MTTTRGRQFDGTDLIGGSAVIDDIGFSLNLGEKDPIMLKTNSQISLFKIVQ